jgi:predicted DNA-binding transcriptional regulator AlpA
MTDRYLSDTDLASRYGVVRQTVWRWAAAGVLPRPVRLSPGCTRWLARDIEGVDAARLSARDAQKAER